jgi:hypothetical protein
VRHGFAHVNGKKELARQAFSVLVAMSETLAPCRVRFATSLGDNIMNRTVLTCSAEFKVCLGDCLARSWARRAEDLAHANLDPLTSSTAALWCLAAKSSKSKEAIPVFGSLLGSFTAQLDNAAVNAKEASTQIIVSTQTRGKKRVRRWSYLLHARVNEFKRQAVF